MPSSVLARTSTALLALALHVVSSDGASLPQARASHGGGSGLAFKALGYGSSSYGRGSSAFSNDSSSSNSTVNTLEDFEDVYYLIDVVIGGQTFTVQFDTGSTDLWVLPGTQNITIVNSTDIEVSETYGKGEVTGPIDFAQVLLGGYTIPSQAFINAETANDFSFPPNTVGILGMSFDDVDISPINAGLKEAWGDDTTLGSSPIASIFAQNPKTPNNFDILLDRSSDLDDTTPGIFLIGEHHPNFSTIDSYPKLLRQTPGRWTALLSSMIVNGQNISTGPSSTVNATDEIVVLLDTGFSFPPLPQPMVDAIYSSIPGAVQYDSSILQWIVPCLASTNVSFVFADVEYSVHPLDLTTIDVITITDDNGQDQNVTFCFNTYQYFPFDPTGQGFDAVMGDAFLRNAYVSFDYGDGDSSGNSSFVQLVPTTDRELAWPDFMESRAAVLQSLPPVIDPQTLLNLVNGDNSSSGGGSSSTHPYHGNAGNYHGGSGNSNYHGGSGKSGSHGSTNNNFGASGAVETTDTPSDSSNDKLTSLVEKYGPIALGLLAANVIIGLVLAIIGITVCVKTVIKTGARARSINPTYAPVRFKEAEAFGAGERETYHD